MKAEEITLFNGTKSYRLVADEGKVLVRKSDNARFGSEISLGFTHYIGGEKLTEPHWETPEDYTEEPMTEDELQMQNEIVQ